MLVGNTLSFSKTSQGWTTRCLSKKWGKNGLTLSEADNRLGVDTQEYRNFITNLYESTKKTGITEGIDRGVTRREGITGERGTETIEDIEFSF